MKKVFGFLLLILLIAFTYYDSFAQCPGCAVNVMLCDSTNSSGEICATLPDGTSGVAYEQEVTFRFPRRFTLQQDDTIPGTAFVFPALPGLPTVIVMDILKVRLDSIGGLPAGLSWECDSSANGCVYIPAANHQHGCVKICGTIDCDASGNSPLTFYFTYTYDGQDFLDAVNGGIPVIIPIPTELPTLTPYAVAFNIQSAGGGTLTVTANKPTIISLGENITLTATPGYAHYSWSTGDTTSEITTYPNQTAFINVEATDDNGCSKSATIGVTVLQPAGIKEKDLAETVRIYPNPNKGKFFIELPYFQLKIGLSLFNIQGKMIYEELPNENFTTTSKKVYLPRLGSGTYFLMLTIGEQKIYKKLIIN